MMFVVVRHLRSDAGRPSRFTVKTSIESISNARCCVGPVALEPRGVLVKLARALSGLELPGGAQGGPRLVVLRVRQVANDVPQLVVATALHLVARAQHLVDRAS